MTTSATGKRDYYTTLGISRGADARAVKDAFRRLAFQYHPDHSSEPDAEERFKEIAEAYAVLSDPSRRAEYDAYGFPGLRAESAEDLFSGIDLADLLGDLGFAGPGGLLGQLFGFAPSGRSAAAPSGSLEVDLEVPLESIARGSEEVVQFSRTAECSTCHGSGAEPGSMPRVCASCEGSGSRTRTINRGGVVLQHVGSCEACRGTGRIVDRPCRACRGSGTERRAEELTLKIPPGIEEGIVLRVAGRGQASGIAGRKDGDLHVVVHSAPHPDFLRRGPDLWRTLPISPADAVLGTKTSVSTLDGATSLRIPAGIEPGTVLRAKGKGLPRFRAHGRGDLYLSISLMIPKELLTEQKGLYERLREVERAGEAGPARRHWHHRRPRGPAPSP